MRCWSNVERVFDELGVTCQEVAVDLELLGGKGWSDIEDLNARD